MHKMCDTNFVFNPLATSCGIARGGWFSVNDPEAVVFVKISVCEQKKKKEGKKLRKLRKLISAKTCRSISVAMLTPQDTSLIKLNK